MINKRTFIVWYIASFIFLVGCSKDEPEAETLVPADVLVINEGNFRSGDGTLSTYNTTTEEVAFSVFASANGYPVAATIQNVIQEGGQLYAVTNAPDKLEVMDAKTYKAVAYIDKGFANPYSFAASGNKGYVTNWGTFNNETYVFGNSFIAVIDLSTYTITDSIMREVQPQFVVAVENSFYVSDVGGSTITVFNASNDDVITVIDVAGSPDRMVVDAENDIWLICGSGNIVKIDTETNKVEKTISGVAVAGFNEKMVINDAGDALYYLSSSGWPDYNSAIYELSTEATEAPESAIIEGVNFYGLGISPNNELFVADANALQGNGTIVRYSLNGTKLGAFAAGRGPNGFIFY